MSAYSRRSRQSINVWPGYVDALAALLMLVIFVLLVFTFAQFMLSQILATQESELGDLEQRLNQLTIELGLEQQKNRALTSNVENLSGMISELTEQRFDLTSQIDQLKESQATDRQQIEQQLLNIASLQQDIDRLRQLRDQLEGEIGKLSANLRQQSDEATQLRDRNKALEARLAEANERTHLAQVEIEERKIRIQALSALVGEQSEALKEQRRLSADAQAEIALLKQRIDGLRSQLEEIGQALALAERQKREQAAEITDLGKRLNVELARRVNELERYRSDFFGQLSSLLKSNPYIQVKGDRFLFQSELLFDSGSAQLGEAGQRQLDELARVLRDVIKIIPEQIDWILRIDGHTDRVPIKSALFASNWELSTARAVSVLRHLAARGISEQRMAATGFAEFHPLNPAHTEAAYRQNRRIEIKLTAR
ncbi:peptidoglycan-binding protein [Sedimenticola thiotaurini]|uniref:Flagellar motor protein MotB n=1 Tax=Sedimenticola thiotaurini TaxID=1543721 RepID=A0A0F7JVW8_9GAMM|nr:peptidoglycan-binding protein [Sedimenticola thiotaurini]AKH20631.1 flagellar motor protein MotB [Sedimenticola thiotaurini]